jgi:hypothetical protein
MSWAIWFVVGWGADASGLPAWTPTLTLVLLVAMLPLIVAAAVVQGGLPGLRIEDEIDPNDLVGLTPEQVIVIPKAHPLYGSGVFTWRNTALGAVSSAALIVTSVVAYMTMWALGIGPVGLLLAQGVISEQDVVVLAGFENWTDDSSLGAFVTDAFHLEMSRSRVVTLAEATPLTREAAYRVAEQEGMRLVVSGDVGRRGAGYVLSSYLSLPTGSMIARFEATSSREDNLLEAIERLSERVREQLGESLRVIREGERLAPIATDSVAALRLYRQVGTASVRGDLGSAIDLLEEALTIDPTFAMGWRRLGVLSEQAADPARARNAYQTVIDLWALGGRAKRTVARMRERIDALE